jgi:hypothetical protein
MLYGISLGVIGSDDDHQVTAARIRSPMTAPKRRWFNDRFVQDGPGRLRAALESEIRPQVVAEYAERLASAGIWKRYRLRREIDREVRRRASEMIRPDALY